MRCLSGEIPRRSRPHQYNLLLLRELESCLSPLMDCFLLGEWLHPSSSPISFLPGTSKPGTFSPRSAQRLCHCVGLHFDGSAVPYQCKSTHHQRHGLFLGLGLVVYPLVTSVWRPAGPHHPPLPGFTRRSCPTSTSPLCSVGL